MMRAVGLLLFSCLWLQVPIAEAHKPSDSYLTVTQPAQGSELAGQWDLALRDLDHAVGLDSNADGEITWGELKARQGAVSQYAFTRLSIEAIARGSRARCPLRFRELLFDEHVDGGYAVLRFEIMCPFRPAQLSVHYGLLFDLDPNHRGLLSIQANGINQAFVLAQKQSTTTLNLASPDRGRQFFAFVEEGIWHIWTGYDHVLFLVTLLLPAVVVFKRGRWEPRSSWRATLVDVLKVVSAFTLAHSLTLSLAVNGLVNLPSRWVESGIALTVLLGALNNLFPVVRERRWLVAFAFGLIHGLGFASVLADLGLSGVSLALALVGFNAGVEIGQLAIVLAFIPPAYALRATSFYQRALMPVGAAVIGCIALYWLGMRVAGVGLN